MSVMDEIAIEEKPKTGTLKIPLDPIHGGLRMAVFGSFLGAGIVGFAAGLYLIPDFAIIAILISAVSAGGTSMGVEKVLKNKWQSGRELVADSERIALTKQGKIDAVINATQQVNILLWYFEIKKDGPRAKKGSLLLALGLEQDDNYIVIYTAAGADDDFENMPLSKKFIKLEKQKKDKKSTLSSTNSMRLAGEQKRLHEAELVRQLVGGDMFFEQFVEMIEFMQTHYPDWMIYD